LLSKSKGGEPYRKAGETVPPSADAVALGGRPAERAWPSPVPVHLGPSLGHAGAAGGVGAGGALTVFNDGYALSQSHLADC